MNLDLVLMGRRALEKEAKALTDFSDKLDGAFVHSCEAIFACQGTVVLTGMGKSGLVARKWASTFSSTGTKAYFINPAEAPHGDLGILHQKDLLIALSYSGETQELSHVVRRARDLEITTIAVTRSEGSSLARQSNILLVVEPSEEACPLGLAPTTSTTLMMALGDALAVTLMQMRGFTETDFAKLHPGGSLGRRLWLRVDELMHRGDAIPKVQMDDPFEKVLIEMTQKFLGLAVVFDGEKRVGVITDGDLRRFIQKNGISPTAKARELMTQTPKTLGQRALALEARELMEKNSIHQLLVEDEVGNLVGVLHLHDLLRAKVV